MCVTVLPVGYVHVSSRSLVHFQVWMYVHTSQVGYVRDLPYLSCHTCVLGKLKQVTDGSYSGSDIHRWNHPHAFN